MPLSRRRAILTGVERVGHFELVAEIARGGMGAVYRARDPHLEREVALKLLHVSEATPAQLQRFQQEARALARVNHPGIVRVIDAGEHQAHPWLAMELVRGESLAARLGSEGPLAEPEAQEIAAQLADVLAHAHAEGVVHRDLKPDNVLLDEQGRARLTDFGLARDLDPDARRTRLTVEGRFMGTPGYWPPEQAHADLARIGPRSDVYGLGATLYALLVGRPPFEGHSLVEVVVATMERPPDPPSQARPEVPAGVDAVCLRCLAKDPDQRWDSAEELAAALRRELPGPAPQRELPGPAPQQRPSARLRGASGPGRESGRVPGTRRASARGRAVSGRLARGPRAQLPAGPLLGGLLGLALLGWWVTRPTAQGDSASAATAAPAPPTASASPGPAPSPRSPPPRPSAPPASAPPAPSPQRPPGPAQPAPPQAQAPPADAQALLARGEHRAALLAAGRALEDDPWDPAARRALGAAAQRLLVGAGRLALEADGSGAWRLLALGALEARRPGPAEEAAERALELAAGDAQAEQRALAARGAARVGQGALVTGLADLDRALALDPEDRLALGWRGEAHLTNGDLERARQDLDRALGVYASEPGLLAVRAEVRRRTGDRAGALDDCERALRLADDARVARALAVRAALREEDGQAAAAAGDWERAHALEPAHPAPLIARALFALQGQRWSEAEQAASLALERAPRQADMWLTRARAREALERPAEALADLERLLELAPRSGEGQARRALLLARRGEPGADEALGEAHALLPPGPLRAEVEAALGAARPASPSAADPDDDAAARADAAARGDGAEALRALLRRGAQQLARCEWEKAEETHARALELDPRSVEALTGQARARGGRQAWQEALQPCEAALRLRPDDPALLTLRARIRYERGQLPPAWKDVSRAVERDPGQVSGWVLRALIARFVKGAVPRTDLERAVALPTPTDEAGQVARAVALLGVGRADEAQALLDGLLERSPRCAEALYARGVVHLEAKRADKGQRDLRAALKADPCHYLAWTLLVDLFLERGEPRTALEATEAALRHLGRCGSLWLDRGRVLLALQRAPEAAEALERGVALLDPDDMRLRQASLDLARARALAGR